MQRKLEETRYSDDFEGGFKNKYPALFGLNVT